MEHERKLATSVALRSLRAELETFLNMRGMIFDPNAVLPIVQRYEHLRDRLRESNPVLFAEVPLRETRPSGTTDYENRGYITRMQLAQLVVDIDHCLQLLSAEAQAVVIPAMTITREGIFFAGQYFDALSRVKEIVDSAKRTIVLIDNYINADVLNMLTSKDAGSTAQILTRDVPADVKAAAGAFNKQYGGLSIRESQAFHDRFIIIDDNEFYHFGASIKDAGNRGFMFSKIEEHDVIDGLRKKVAQEWIAAKVIV